CEPEAVDALDRWDRDNRRGEPERRRLAGDVQLDAGEHTRFLILWLPVALAAGQPALEQADKLSWLLAEDEHGPGDASDSAGAADRSVDRASVLVEVMDEDECAAEALTDERQPLERLTGQLHLRETRNVGGERVEHDHVDRPATPVS